MEEYKRLQKLAEYEIMNTLPEKEFDDIVELASELYGVSISAITLMDNYRYWIKAQVGVDYGGGPREDTYCHHTLAAPNNEVTVINDSLLDERVKANPFTLGEPYVRFYAAAPLVTVDGYILGTLCIFDKKPRAFSKQEEALLRALAKRVMRHIEIRRENLLQKRIIDKAADDLAITLNRFKEAQQTAHVGNWDFNVRTQELYWSPEMFRLLLKEESTDEKGNLADWENFVHQEDLHEVRYAMETALRTRKPTSSEFRIVKHGVETWLLGKADIKLNGEGKVERIFGTLQDITERKKAERDRTKYTQTLEEMLFSVSHEMRKPVTTILGLLPMLQSEKLTKDSLTEICRHFETSAKELEAFTRQLNELLHKSKIDFEGIKGEIKLRA